MSGGADDGDVVMFSQGASSLRSNGAGAISGSRSSTNGASGNAGGASLNGSSNGASSNGDKGPAAPSSSSSSRPANALSETYQGHSREEMTRLLLQALNDMGYQDAAKSVSRDSGYELENSTVAAFRTAVLEGSWAKADNLLTGAAESDEARSTGGKGNGLVLAKCADLRLMRFWLKQQKYLEILEAKNAAHALSVLREEITPLYNDTAKLHFLSSLLMCQSPEDLKARASWDGAGGESRKILLSDLSKCISPSVMLPENRLAVLLQSVKQSQIDTCLYHTAVASPSLYTDHRCARSRFPSEMAMDLLDLGGEAWQVRYSPDGRMLAACGESGVVIWDSQYNVHLKPQGHEGGVGNISWSPDSSMLVTCSQDNTAMLYSVTDGECLKRTKRFSEPVSSCVWARNGQSFTLGTLDDKNSICTYTRSANGWEVDEWTKSHRVQDLCGSADGRWLVAADNLSKIHVYNARTRELEYEMEMAAGLASVCISEDSRHLLVNRKDGEAQMLNLETRALEQKFLGHKGGDYLIRAGFGGANESFVVSGSEDGHILVWHKRIGAAVERLQGHRPRCNAVSWKPDDPTVFASCGDDGRVKIWTNKSNARALREAGQQSAPGSQMI
ncbi:WD repeat-containing protein 26 [Geosmithia morbida]|uniref:WD repeat-containing protein 26 n=1 Tax=Geosmithia morbida TaxID=1094350 RepID=A0A9P4YN49_9HYPO|nr:WD repeat-containing protein 26 [Geosmithia morbida]KAF4119640.1 WD repeat-containing protein 26 [Geosmithia morbida]